MIFHNVIGWSVPLALPGLTYEDTVSTCLGPLQEEGTLWMVWPVSPGGSWYSWRLPSVTAPGHQKSKNRSSQVSWDITSTAFYWSKPITGSAAFQGEENIGFLLLMWRVAQSCCLILGQFLSPSCFSWPFHFWRVLVKYFVEYLYLLGFCRGLSDNYMWIY